MKIVRGAALFVALILAVGCSPSAAGSSAAEPAEGDAVTFTIDDPAPGTVVTTSPLTISGRAPAGTRIVRDISFAPDQDVIADTSGRWTMQVELEEGANELVLRVGDDQSTEQRLGITYTPTTAAETEEPDETAGSTATEDPATPDSPEEDPTPEPTRKPSFRTFGDGTWEVGSDIKPGTYRLREPTGFCYWARLKGFGGDLNDIIANDNVVDAYAVVRIAKNDAGFESNGCGEWTTDLSRLTGSRSAIDADGTYIVGTDIAPGKWRSTGGEFCYWARLKGFSGTLNDILANDNVLGGRTIVTIKKSDKGFVTRGCGTWTRS